MLTHRRVEGKTAIVTGGGKGIGRAVCLMLAREGAKVAVLDTDDAAGRDVVERIVATGGEARFWKLNVGNEKEVASAFSEVAKHFGEINVLVNNAAIAGINLPTHEVMEKDWDEVMKINVKGVFFGVKHAVPFMKKAGGGSIINLSSIYGLISAPDVPPYHASKGAVRLMTKTDALLYSKDKIRVNSIHPGFIWTPMVEDFLRSQGDVNEGIKAVASLHPMGHMGEPDDIAYGVLYLASDESKFVTGSELVIDGGYTAR